VLFNPVLANKESDGIHKITHDCIIKCDNDIKKDLFKNIVLAGGCTMFEGMKERMKKEI
jgi:actin-related protein